MYRLEGRIAIVTGGGSGIGYEIATTLGRHGCKLAIVDRDEEKGMKAAKELDSITETRFFKCDVSIVDDIRSVFEDVLACYGQADILVNNAGMAVRDYIENITETKWDVFMSTNAKSAFFFSQIFAEHVKARGSGYGRIINISSIRTEMIDTYHSGYTISKTAVEAITKCFAVSYGQYGITANDLSPGLVLTPMTQHYLDDPKATNILETLTPIRRMVDVSELANLTAYLASEQAAAVNGQIITVNGGGMSFPGLYH